MGADGLEFHKVLAVCPESGEVQPHAQRIPPQEVQVFIPYGTVGMRNNPAQDGISPVKILLEAPNQVVGQRLHSLGGLGVVLINMSALLQGKSVQDPKEKSAGGPSRYFHGPSYGGEFGHPHHPFAGGEGGCVPNAAGIEQFVPVKIEGKNVVALYEERAFLLEICFKSGQVHFGRIGLDLPEM